MQRKRPLHGKIFARCVPERLFAGLFGCMARISCQSQLILDTRRRYAATNWRFSRPRPLSGCMERKTCHGLPPGDAFREHFSIGKRPGTHRGGILPRQDPRERIAREYCHCQSPKSASGRNPVTVGRWETHFACILPSSSARERIFATSCQQSGIFVRAGLLPCHSSRTA